MGREDGDIDVIRSLVDRLYPAECKVQYDEHNRVQSLDISGCELTEVPVELFELRHLRHLGMSDNALSEIPSELLQLTEIETLDCSMNGLSTLPSTIRNLSNLTTLHLSDNNLSRIPTDLFALDSLRILGFARNNVSSLSALVANLVGLEELDLSGNNIVFLPDALGENRHLTRIDVTGNPIRQLPVRLGEIDALEWIGADSANLTTIPPPEIVSRGSAAIIAYLRELAVGSKPRFEAKLMLVGEGGTGKSSLLAALRNGAFDSQRETTHGVEVDSLWLPYARDSEVQIVLNTWDFGGQQIYHATHQFFLTKRSLYIVVWNARLGSEQGRLDYWLKAIGALAPDCPILLVATHIDERAPDINFPALKEAFPNLVGSFSVSNKDGTGVSDVRDALGMQASMLPLMGQEWPTKWTTAEAILLDKPDHHIGAQEYLDVCNAVGIDAEDGAPKFADYLHDLGKILYFQDDDLLSDLVVLKPNWVTKAISLVLTDNSTRDLYGILSHAELPRIWREDEDGERYDRRLYPVFLRLMEKFDLSYQLEASSTERHPTRSLIPQLLPHEPPPDTPQAPGVPHENETRVEMIYRLNIMPPGIIPWFIVRTHQYTTNQHWRDGVVLQYEGHTARVELNAILREVRVVVWGPQPHNFFGILKATLDLILRRFEGLDVLREVPCICHWDRNSAPCGRFYRYEDLARRMAAQRFDVECPETYAAVSVRAMLYGIHDSTTPQVLDDIRKAQQDIQSDLKATSANLIARIDQQAELIGRTLMRNVNHELERLEQQCPSAFCLMPLEGGIIDPRNMFTSGVHMYLLCQNPAGPHLCEPPYQVRRSKEWWATIRPWLATMAQYLKYAIPAGKASQILADSKVLEEWDARATMMAGAAGAVDDKGALAIAAAQEDGSFVTDMRAYGPMLRVLYQLLDTVDPSHYWSGLYRTATPDGNVLWLCESHRQPYLAKALTFDEARPELPNTGPFSDDA